VKEDITRLSMLACFFIVAEATVPPAFLFGASYAGIALNAYIAVGIALFVFGTVFERLRRDEGRHRLETLIVTLNTDQDGIARWRARLYLWMFVVIGVTCWPAMQFGLHAFRLAPTLQRTNSMLGVGAGLTLFPIETSVALFVALAPAILTVIALSHEPPFVYSTMFLWIIVASILLRHLSSLISGDTVQAKLRRGMDPVMFSYALISGGDLIGLVLSYNGIIHWNSGSVFSLEQVQSIFTQLLAFRDFFNVFEHPPDTVLAYCVGVSGLLWWLTLAQGIFQLNGYKRAPSDYLSLAASCTMLGKTARAKTFLDAAAATTKEECYLKGSVHAARGEFDKAALCVRRALNQTENVPATDGYILRAIFSGMLALRVDQDRYYEYVKYGADHGLTDLLLSNLAMLYCISGGSARAFSDHLKEKWPDRFPLTYLCLKWLADEEREILDAFQAAEPKSAGAERALWLCIEALLWPARRTSDGETAQFLDHWAGPVLEEIRVIAVALSDDIDKCALIDMLDRVRGYWANFGVQLYPVGAVHAAIQETLPENEEIRKMKAAWAKTAPVPATGAAQQSVAA
jgi:hypothetical protein